MCVNELRRSEKKNRAFFVFCHYSVVEQYSPFGMSRSEATRYPSGFSLCRDELINLCATILADVSKSFDLSCRAKRDIPLGSTSFGLLEHAPCLPILRLHHG